MVIVGVIFFFLNWWLLFIDVLFGVCVIFYIMILVGGFFSLLVLGLWISCLLKNNLLEDVFNIENELFM